MRLRAAKAPCRPAAPATTPRRYLVVPCPYCGGSNARSVASKRRRHRPRLSGRVVGRWYVCGDCGRTFATIEYAVVSESDISAGDHRVA